MFAIYNCASASSNEGLLKYRVRDEDNVGQILDYLGLCPRWSRRPGMGQVVKVIDLNPVLRPMQGNLIYPGQILMLPVASLTENPDYAVSPSLEVRFLTDTPSSKCSKQNSRQKLVSKASVAPAESPLQQSQVLQMETLPDHSFEAPNSEPTSSENQGFREHGAIAFLPGFAYSGQGLTDTSTNPGARAVLLSKTNPSFQFIWSQYWSERLQTSLRVGLEKSTLQGSATTQLSGGTEVLTSFDFTSALKLSPRLEFVSGLGEHQDLLVRAINPNALIMDNILIARINAGARYLVYHSEAFLADAHAGLIALAPTKSQNVDAKVGFGGYLEGRLSESITERLSLLGVIHFETLIQNTTLYQKSESEMALSVGISFKIGK